MTIAKNTKSAKRAIANATDIRCFSLGNNFSGQPLADSPVVWGGPIVNNQFTKMVPVTQSEFLYRELNNFKGAKLTVNANGRYELSIHSNLWYEFYSPNGE